MFIFFLSLTCSPFSSFYCFQIDVKPISIYHLVGEEAPVEAGVSAGVASTEGTVPKKEEVSTATDIPMEVFLMVLTLLLRP